MEDLNQEKIHMNANETKLQPILEGTKQYVVPLFQRPYSWEKDQWERLWDDIKELCEDPMCEDPTPRTHFLGSIVTLPTRSVPEGVTKYLLIDGQQRLTTIFIILSILRDKSITKGNEILAEEIQNTLLVNTYKKDTEFFKLLPTQIDRTYFERLIKDQIIDGTNQITTAYKYFERKLSMSGIDEETVKKVITNHLSVISILLDLNDNPYLVFESLNAKGKPLSQADLIRNYFFMRIHVNQQDAIHHQYWKPMQDALGDNLTEFIRHYIMKDGTIVKQNDIYFHLKEVTKNGDVIKWLMDIKKFSEYYEKLTNPEREDVPDLKRRLLRLNRLQVTTTYPFLLNCYDDYYSGKMTCEQFREVLSILENFIIRRFICNIPTNQLNKIFSPLNLQIRNSGYHDFIEGLRYLLQNKGYPGDIEFKERLRDTKLYGASDRAKKTRLILETIEESYSHKEKINFDDNSIGIEHIMPQKLNGYWRNQLGEDWEKTHNLLLHTIGNLTLTAYNSEISNGGFEQKKSYYINSHLEMNKYFEKTFSWTKEDIESRSEYLAGKALEIWPYFGNESTKIIEKSSYTGKTPRILKFLGQNVKVTSWKDVLVATMNMIAEDEPEKFSELVKHFPAYINMDGKKFRDPRQLNNGTFVEVDHLSARTTQRLCIQALETIGLTAEDWEVDTAEK